MVYMYIYLLYVWYMYVLNDKVRTFIMEGVHFLASLIQLERVERGTTMRKGPLLCLNSITYARRAKVWMVFPAEKREISVVYVAVEVGVYRGPFHLPECR